MSYRLTANGHQVTVLTTNARCASDFWQSGASLEPGVPAREVLDSVIVERLPLVYPWPAPYTFGLLRRVGLWLQLSGLPSRVVRPVQGTLARYMPPLRGLPEALERWTPQVDLIHSDDSSWDGLLMASAHAAQRYKKPLVVRPLMHLGSAWVRAHYQMAHQVEAYRQASAVLALSRREAQAYAALGVSPDRVHIIPMGISNTMPGEGLDPAGFRHEHGLGDHVSRSGGMRGLDFPLAREYLIAFVGANTRDKGAFALVRAVAQLALQGLSVDLVCAGSQDAGLRAFVKQQPESTRRILQNHVHILGVVDQRIKERLLAACDLLALPSQVDTFGIVFLEAWKHGKPVIGADAGGIPDLVRHEENGLIVPFGNVPALAAAVRRLLQEPELAARLGRSGQRTVQAYTWDQTYRMLVEIYRTVLAVSS